MYMAEMELGREYVNVYLWYIYCKTKDWIHRDNTSLRADQDCARVMNSGCGLLLYDLSSFVNSF
jgi:hypothetical protein